MKQVISIRLKQSTIDKLKVQAKKENRSLSNLVGMMIEQSFKKKDLKEFKDIIDKAVK